MTHFYSDRTYMYLVPFHEDATIFIINILNLYKKRIIRELYCLIPIYVKKKHSYIIYIVLYIINSV